LATVWVGVPNAEHVAGLPEPTPTLELLGPERLPRHDRPPRPRRSRNRARRPGPRRPGRHAAAPRVGRTAWHRPRSRPPLVDRRRRVPRRCRRRAGVRRPGRRVRGRGGCRVEDRAGHRRATRRGPGLPTLVDLTAQGRPAGAPRPPRWKATAATPAHTAPAAITAAPPAHAAERSRAA